MKKRKLLERILNNPKSFDFMDLVRLAEAFGFHLERSNGSHFIFKHAGVPELLNLQSVKGQAKPYQVRQFLVLIERYSLKLEDE
jgi:HicA toxin of bacterial toxin-antitoxin,